MAKEQKAADTMRLRAGLLRKLSVPEDALPGSLSMSRLRCGKENCHCKKDEKHKHTVWSLTYMSGGKKRVQHIPADLVEYVKEKVSQGKDFKEIVNQIFVANADLLVLRRKKAKADQ
jgi:uncharacterized protein DUF6788